MIFEIGVEIEIEVMGPPIGMGERQASLMVVLVVIGSSIYSLTLDCSSRSNFVEMDVLE